MAVELLKNIDAELLRGASCIILRLREAGHEAYIAGGAVRDLILGRSVGDLDVATSADPDTVGSLFPATIPVGKQFGVMIVVENGINYEVATFREEGDYSDGRRPDRVEFVDARTDAQRRDFTVNGLLLDPSSGEILDYCEGRKDLEAKIIRTIGKPTDRFGEDKLRLIRAVRFAAQLGFEIDAETWSELRSQARGIEQVSCERIRDELLKMLTAEHADRGLRLLLASGLLAVILPEVAAMLGVEQPPEFHPEGDVWIHTCLMFSLVIDPSETLALGMLLHDVGKPLTYSVRDRIRFDGHAEVGADLAARICRRLRVSNQQLQTVVELVRQHLRFMHVQQMRESKLKRFLRQESFDEHLELHRVDCLASHGDLTAYEFCRQKLDELGEEEIKPAPLLDGHDLIALGLEPGPRFGELLSAVEDKQLEREFKSREEALEWVRRELNLGG